ncbi:hypothetical protein HDV02_003622 [Globomyces sp. JEL0801]|nr:hypothetical protein HDV02_003622 [Globomyces sp. JEL0801]
MVMDRNSDVMLLHRSEPSRLISKSMVHDPLLNLHPELDPDLVWEIYQSQIAISSIQKVHEKLTRKSITLLLEILNQSNIPFLAINRIGLILYHSSSYSQNVSTTHLHTFLSLLMKVDKSQMAIDKALEVIEPIILQSKTRIGLNSYLLLLDRASQFAYHSKILLLHQWIHKYSSINNQTYLQILQIHYKYKCLSGFTDAIELFNLSILDDIKIRTLISQFNTYIQKSVPQATNSAWVPSLGQIHELLGGTVSERLKCPNINRLELNSHKINFTSRPDDTFDALFLHTDINPNDLGQLTQMNRLSKTTATNLDKLYYYLLVNNVPLTNNILSIIAAGYIRFRIFEKANPILMQLHLKPISSKCYFQLIDAYLSINDYTTALKLFETTEINSPYVSLMIESFLKYFLKSKGIELGFEFYMNLKQDGNEVTSNMYSTLLKLFSDDKEKIEEVWSDLQRKHTVLNNQKFESKIPTYSISSPLNTSHIEIMIKHYVSTRQYDRILKIFEEYSSMDLTPQMLVEIARSFMHEDEPAKVQQLSQLNASLGFRLDAELLWIQLDTWRNTTKYKTIKNITKIELIIKDGMQQNVKFNRKVYQSIIFSYAKYEKWWKACFWIHEMSKQGFCIKRIQRQIKDLYREKPQKLNVDLVMNRCVKNFNVIQWFRTFSSGRINKC